MRKTNINMMKSLSIFSFHLSYVNSKYCLCYKHFHNLEKRPQTHNPRALKCVGTILVEIPYNSWEFPPKIFENSRKLVSFRIYPHQYCNLNRWTNPCAHSIDVKKFCLSSFFCFFLQVFLVCVSSVRVSCTKDTPI